MPINRKRDIIKINPIDTKKDVAVGISYPFDNRIFNSTYTTKDQLKSNLINFLLTNKGEKLFDPNFGSDLKYRLFEPMTDELETLITTTLTDDLQFYIPELQLTKFNYSPTPDQHKIEISLEFKYLLDNTIDNINISVNE